MVVVTISILGTQVPFAEMLLPGKRLVLLQQGGLVGFVDKLLPRPLKLTRVPRECQFLDFFFILSKPLEHLMLLCKCCRDCYIEVYVSSFESYILCCCDIGSIFFYKGFVSNCLLLLVCDI